LEDGTKRVASAQAPVPSNRHHLFRRARTGLTHQRPPLGLKASRILRYPITSAACNAVTIAAESQPCWLSAASRRSTSARWHSSVAGLRTAAHPAATPAANAASIERPWASLSAIPARKLSPAPTVLTAFTSGAARRSTPAEDTSMAPSAPSVSATY